MQKSTNLVGSRPQTRIDQNDAVIAAAASVRHSQGTAPMSASLAPHGLTFLTPTLRLPRGTRYVVRMTDNDSLIIYLVSDRKWKQRPCWKRISSLILCKRVVENIHHGKGVPQRGLYV